MAAKRVLIEYLIWAAKLLICTHKHVCADPFPFSFSCLPALCACQTIATNLPPVQHFFLVVASSLRRWRLSVRKSKSGVHKKAKKLIKCNHQCKTTIDGRQLRLEGKESSLSAIANAAAISINHLLLASARRRAMIGELGRKWSEREAGFANNRARENYRLNRFDR